MAQSVRLVLIDDVDGTEADQTVTFALDGVSYEIDLNDQHATQLRHDLGAWIEHARRVGGRRHHGVDQWRGRGVRGGQRGQDLRQQRPHL